MQLKKKKKKTESTEEVIKKHCKEVSVIQGVEGIPDLDAMKKLKRTMYTLLEQEEIQWKQKVKINCLQYGNKNTKFFHVRVNQKHKSNCICMICDAKGILWDDSDNIGNAFVDYSLICSLRSSRNRWIFA